ncbi:MAG: hypothetical protein AAGI68_07345 [Planctomycetota bacterium]
MLLRIADQGITLPHRLDDASRPRRPGPRLGAVVLLAGAVRVSHLRKASGRGALEMPVGSTRRVLDCWQEQLVALAESLGRRKLPVRIIVDQTSRVEPRTIDLGPVEIVIERDPAEFRGTGGLLSDLAKAYPDDEHLLVGHASQLLFTPLAELVGRLLDCPADVAMLCREDDSPTGLMRMRCGALRSINTVGFVDLNEQALPAIAEACDVRVVRTPGPVAMSVRTLEGYIHTLRAYHRYAAGRLHPHGRPLREDWEPAYQIVESGAAVSAKAVVHDSVVLNGARVEAGAVVVRSVVCPGAVVARNQRVIDRIASAAGVIHPAALGQSA